MRGKKKFTSAQSHTESRAHIDADSHIPGARNTMQSMFLFHKIPGSRSQRVAFSSGETKSLFSLLQKALLGMVAFSSAISRTVTILQLTGLCQDIRASHSLIGAQHKSNKGNSGVQKLS